MLHALYTAPNHQSLVPTYLQLMKLPITHTDCRELSVNIHIYPQSNSPGIAVADPSNKLSISSLIVKSIAIQAIVLHLHCSSPHVELLIKELLLYKTIDTIGLQIGMIKECTCDMILHVA